MCTVILYRNSEYTLLGVNRDVDPTRPSEPPNIAEDYWAGMGIPRVLTGGRDVRGGTQLAHNDTGLVAAIVDAAPSSRLGNSTASRDYTNGELPLAALAFASAQEAKEALLSSKVNLPVSGKDTLDLNHYKPHFLIVADNEHAYALEYDGITPNYLVHKLETGFHIVDVMGVNGQSSDGRTSQKYLHLKSIAESTVTATVMEGQYAPVNEVIPQIQALLTSTEQISEPSKQDGIRSLPPALSAACIDTPHFATVDSNILCLPATGQQFSWLRAEVSHAQTTDFSPIEGDATQLSAILEKNRRARNAQSLHTD